MCLRELPGVERRRPGRDEALGGDDEPVPFPLQPAAEDFLGDPAGTQVPAERVGVRGVDEVDAAFGRAVEDRPRGRFVALQTERHRSQAQPGDLQAGSAESGVIHGRTLPSRSGDGLTALGIGVLPQQGPVAFVVPAQT